MRREEVPIEEGANARAAPLEIIDVEWRIEPPQLIAARIVGEGVRVLPALLVGFAQSKMQLCLVGPAARLVGEQRLHAGQLGIAECVVLEIGKAPPGLGEARIQRQRGVIRRLAVLAPAERLQRVADREVQARFRRFQARDPLIGLERLLLVHEAGRHRRDREPGLRIIRLDFGRVVRRCLRFRKPPERHQRRPESTPGERQMGGLPERVPQQALGVLRLVRRQ